MGYWACAQLQPRHERLALHCLQLAGYMTYFPRLHERRIRRGRGVDVEAPLFPGYAFVIIELQWSRARWAPGVAKLVMDGAVPARVPDGVIAGIRNREVGGAVVLPRRSPRHGDAIQILHGPFRGHLALYAGMAPRERVAVLLTILGSPKRVTLAQQDVEAIIS